MAIAYDTSGGAYSYNTSLNQANFNLTAASSGSIALLFVIYNPGTAGEAWANTPTVGGAASTQIGTTFAWSGNQRMKMFYYLNPPTSSTNYELTTDTFAVDKDAELQVLIYSGAKQSGQPDGYDDNDSGTPTATLSVDSVTATDCWLVSCGRNVNGGVVNASTGTTKRSAAYQTSFSSGDSNGTVGTGSQSMAWTEVSGITAGLIVSIAPSTAASVNSGFFNFMN